MRTLAIILLTAVATLWPLSMAVPIAQAVEPCEHVGYQQIQWTAEVRGVTYTGCIGNSGSPASDKYVRMAAQQDAAYAYSADHLHELRTGNYDADGFDPGISVKPSEVRVISIERRK